MFVTPTHGDIRFQCISKQRSIFIYETATNLWKIPYVVEHRALSTVFLKLSFNLRSIFMSRALRPYSSFASLVMLTVLAVHIVEDRNPAST